MARLFNTKVEPVHKCALATDVMDCEVQDQKEEHNCVIVSFRGGFKKLC